MEEDGMGRVRRMSGGVRLGCGQLRLTLVEAEAAAIVVVGRVERNGGYEKEGESKVDGGRGE